MMFSRLKKFALLVLTLLSLGFSCRLMAEIFSEYEGFKILRAESPLPADKDAAQVFKETADFIAEKLQNTPHNGNEAVIIDIDGTILAIAGVFTPAVRSITPTLDIFNAAIKSGRTVFFVTTRYEDGKAGTVAELKAIGIESGSYELIMYPESSSRGSRRRDRAEVKGRQRREIQEQRYNIVLTIDDDPDNLNSDFGPTGEETLLVPDAHDLEAGGLLGKEIPLAGNHPNNGR